MPFVSKGPAHTANRLDYSSARQQKAGIYLTKPDQEGCMLTYGKVAAVCVVGN